MSNFMWGKEAADILEAIEVRRHNEMLGRAFAQQSACSPYYGSGLQNAYNQNTQMTTSHNFLSIFDRLLGHH